VGAHSSSDDPRAYRSDEEVSTSSRTDPIFRFCRYLSEKNLWNAAKEETLQEEVKNEISAAVAEAEKFGPPPVNTMFEDVYGEIPQHIREQQDYLLDYLKRNPKVGEVK
jgi:TPP-dependent pyruvate/acetoin dehydrogenase alpha subunit